MTALDVVKTGAGLLVSACVGAVVKGVVNANTPASIKGITAIGIGVGTAVLAALSGDAAADYVEREIDSTIETVKELTEAITPKQELEEVGPS